jgi:hypothetical protein
MIIDGSELRRQLRRNNIDFGGFVQVNKYMQVHDDPQYFIIYKRFGSLGVVTPGDLDLRRIITQLVDLMQIPSISDSIRIAAM